jgi:predicted amidohydrolase
MTFPTAMKLTGSMTSSTIRVALTQHEPIYFNLSSTVTKACTLIAEAADHGAKLISFPEVWIPGYPAWIW